MATLSKLSLVTRTSLLLACAWVFSVAAQDAQQGPPPAVETESAKEPAQEIDLADIDSDANDDGEVAEEESGARFIPTEEISQDFGVSFPVDI
ncbi:MAG: hypothetical protein ISP89_08735 [Pseudomonadales bacterium]|nr:hypothetical protein [Pseudomonadales bacterium]